MTLKERMAAVYVKNGLPADTTGVMVCTRCETLVVFDDVAGDHCACTPEQLRESSVTILVDDIVWDEPDYSEQDSEQTGRQ